MNIAEQITNCIKLGLMEDDAIAKVCGEIILSKIAKSSKSRNVTIKGGVVMMNISKDLRRATRDLDLDFIKYSLADDSIKKFINRLNEVNDDIKLVIQSRITGLRHQDYKGKRVILNISDKFKNSYEFKLDIGVHKNLDLKQEELCFDFNSMPESVCLLVNSKEQILAEKLKSLLKFGFGTGRYKDVFDIYYLIEINPVDKNILKFLLDDYIIKNAEMWENNYNSVYNRLLEIFENRDFYNSLSNARDNWLELPIDEIIGSILNFFELFETVEV